MYKSFRYKVYIITPLWRNRGNIELVIFMMRTKCRDQWTYIQCTKKQYFFLSIATTLMSFVIKANNCVRTRDFTETNRLRKIPMLEEEEKNQEKL